MDIPTGSGQDASGWRPEGGSWGAPPVKQSYAAQLSEARHAGRRTQRDAEVAGLRQLCLTAEELAASWALMDAASRSPAGCLGNPLSEEEVGALLEAHGDARPAGWLSTAGRPSGRVLRVASLVEAVLAEQFRSGGGGTSGLGAAEPQRTHEGIPTAPEDFRCRIKYRPARGTVSAPTSFDAAAAMESSKVRRHPACIGPLHTTLCTALARAMPCHAHAARHWLL